jgi:hypothetical protein
MCLNTSLSDALLSGPLMLAKKTVKAKILELRKGKKQLLEEEYQNYQRYLRGDRDGIKLCNEATGRQVSHAAEKAEWWFA